MNTRKLCVVLLFLATTALAQDILRVPSGKPAMIDGKLAQAEWSDSKAIDLGKTARLYAKHSRDYVWLAIEALQGDNGALDLYLATSDGAIFDLHSSAKLGERTFTNSSWPDFTWWNNTGWVSNFSRVDSWKDRSFFPEKIREYQISRARFAGNEWKVMFELMTPAKPEWQTHKIPVNAQNTDARGWLTVRFD